MNEYIDIPWLFQGILSMDGLEIRGSFSRVCCMNQLPKFTPKRWVILITALIIVITVVMINKSESRIQKVNKDVEKKVFFLKKDHHKTIQDSNLPPKPLNSPKVPTQKLFEAFDSQTQDERQKFIKANLSNHDLSRKEYAWLKNRIEDKSLYIVNRNYMASMMVNQRRKDPDLYKLFIQFYEDPEETFQWREYSVQFIGQALPLQEERQIVHSKLIEIAREDKTLIAGTAMMQLVQQEGFGNIQLDFRFDDLLDKHLKSEATKTSVKMSLIGIIGKRKESTNKKTSLNDALREYNVAV